MLPRKPRMRPPDSRRPDFHLLEVLARPLACVNGARIGVWVYRRGSQIREIVLSGHAEFLTCSQVTSLLIECAKKLDENARWMLTCGAGFFRIDDSVLRPRPELKARFGRDNNQAQLVQLVAGLRELEAENGLVSVLDRDWQELVAFRQAFRNRVSSHQPLILTPSGTTSGQIADYLPVVPGSNPEGEPLVFTLEGWDFDCPEFQAVSDRHLRNMQRELLADAHRRRRKYRSWLRDWMEEWIRELSFLPEEQARAVRLLVPPPHDAGGRSRPVEVPQFLRLIAAEFLDRGQTWPSAFAELSSQLGFGRQSAAFLDELRTPTVVTEIDFQRARETTRAGTSEDAFTLRQRIRESRPQMISHCLRYIRMMDGIIQPYERLRSHLVGRAGPGRELSKEDRGIRVVADISRRIAMETMIRGWPSIYLPDQRDQDVFGRWEKRVRPHVWFRLSKQAHAAGVALEQLLEDNVVYDVQFNDDLGCTIQPFVLVDDGGHAQVHGSRAGASVVVPVWKRAVTRTVPAPVLALGETNDERAEALVKRAARRIPAPRGMPQHQLADDPVQDLRLALACSPGRAGRRILEEWGHRLGRDTSGEFGAAQLIVEAAELCSRGRFVESASRLGDYLKLETRPVRDVYVMAALGELMGEDERLGERREAAERADRLIRLHSALLEKVRQRHPELGQGIVSPTFQASLGLDPTLGGDLERLRQLHHEIERLTAKLRLLDSSLAEETVRRKRRIREALETPGRPPQNFPAVTRAARKTPQELRALLEGERLERLQLSEDFFRRYGPARGLIETRGLIDLSFALSVLRHRIEENPNQARQDALLRMAELSRHLWLPREVEGDLKTVGEEFGKGNWDRIQAEQIRGILNQAIGTCRARLRDLMSDRVVSEAPFAEVLETRVHLVQTFEGRYRTALQMLAGATTRFGRVTAEPWRVLDASLEEVPEEARLEFDADSGLIELVSKDERTALLQGAALSVVEKSHIDRLLADPQLVQRIHPLASSVAEGLLAVEVAPSDTWQAWREAMQAVQAELLFAVSSFRHQACLLPEHLPMLPRTEEGNDEKKRRDQMLPRLEPAVDWAWPDLDRWTEIVGPGARRALLEVPGPKLSGESPSS